MTSLTIVTGPVTRVVGEAWAYPSVFRMRLMAQGPGSIVQPLCVPTLVFSSIQLRSCRQHSSCPAPARPRSWNSALLDWVREGARKILLQKPPSRARHQGREHLTLRNEAQPSLGNGSKKIEDPGYAIFVKEAFQNVIRLIAPSTISYGCHSRYLCT